MNVITMQGLFERDLVTGAGLVGSQTWPAPVAPSVDCLRACGNKAQSPQNSVFQLCEDCADAVYRLFIMPVNGADAVSVAYQKTVDMYGR